jgi:hypothetical protein
VSSKLAPGGTAHDALPVGMLIEPRQVEPGAIVRWSGQAVLLIARGWAFWIAISLLFCLWMFLGQGMPLLDAMLALTSFFASILVAARLDRPGPVTLSDVLAMLRAHMRLVAGFVVIIALSGAVIWALLFTRPGVPWWEALYGGARTPDRLSGDWLDALRQVFVFSAYALGLTYFGLNIPGLTSFYQFPVAALLGVRWREAYHLGAVGQVKNLPAILSVGLMFVLLPVAFVLLAPVLIPVLYCFLAAVCYVGFRDIFLGIPENQFAGRLSARGRHRAGDPL